ncbi:MAG: SRPBCC family protein [Phycisphaerales bacterium]
MSDCTPIAITGPSRVAASVTRNVIEVPINAAAERVWRAMVEQMDQWWLPHFRMAPSSKRVVLEARVGGRWYEASGKGGDGGDDAGILWGNVVSLDPPNSLTLRGEVAPPWGASVFMLVLEIVAAPVGSGCTLRTIHMEIGDVSDKQAQSMHDGWTELLRDGLKKFCEA